MYITHARYQERSRKEPQRNFLVTRLLCFVRRRPLRDAEPPTHALERARAHLKPSSRIRLPQPEELHQHLRRHVQMLTLGLEVPRPATHAHTCTWFHVHASDCIFFNCGVVFVGCCKVF